MDETTELDEVEMLVEDYSARLKSGNAPSVEEYIRLHPKHAEELRELLSAIMTMEGIRDLHQTAQSQKQVPDNIGDFQILREIGRGGMGVVYEAIENPLKRRVALKTLPHDSLQDPTRLQRFQREACAAARLHHTNIVPVFGTGFSDGTHYFIMQFIDGLSLNRIVAGLKLDSGFEKNIPRYDASNPSKVRLFSSNYWKWAAEIILQVADALHYAHANHIVHRDIKPGNIIIDSSGIAWVADFGLAKFGEDEGLTRTGDIIGTLQYLAPEALTGSADSRGDIYSLGLTLYELLTLQQPYPKTTAAGMLKSISMQRMLEPRKVNSRIPIDLETIVIKAAASDVEKRYQTAKEFSEDLRRFLDDRPILARKANKLELLLSWCNRNRTLAALSATAIISVITTFAIGYIGYSRTARALERVAQESKLAEAERRRAEENLQLSLSALENMFQQLESSEWPPRQLPSRITPVDILLMHRPPAGLGQSGVSVELLQAILNFYEDFAQKNLANTKLLVESARAYTRVGALQLRLGDSLKAEKAFGNSLSTINTLRAAGNGSREIDAMHATALFNLGELLSLREETVSAEKAFREAIQLLTPLVQDNPRLRFDMVRLQVGFARLMNTKGAYDESIAALKWALFLCTNKAETNFALASETPRIYLLLSEVYKNKGDMASSRDALAKSTTPDRNTPIYPNPHFTRPTAFPFGAPTSVNDGATQRGNPIGFPQKEPVERSPSVIPLSE